MSTKTGITLKSCRRQFVNFKRVFKVAEEMRGSLWITASSTSSGPTGWPGALQPLSSSPTIALRQGRKTALSELWGLCLLCWAHDPELHPRLPGGWHGHGLRQGVSPGLEGAQGACGWQGPSRPAQEPGMHCPPGDAWCLFGDGSQLQEPVPGAAERGRQADPQ